MHRVCLTVDSAYVGGAERYVELIASQIDRSRFAPSVVASDAPGLRDWLGALADRGVRVRVVPMDVPFRAGRAAGVVRAFQDIAPDLVHVNMPGPYDGQMGLLAPLARLAGAARVITTEHLPMVERLWKRALVKRMAMPFVDRVLTVSQANIAYLTGRQRIPRDKIEVVYNGVRGDFGRGGDRALTRRAQSIDDGTVAVVIVGAVSERKGHGLLIDALAGLPHEPWQLFVIGDGPDRTRFESLAVSRGVGDRVRFMGSLAEAEVAAFLPAMDMLALPSTMEGLPYVILEAMACALPVVASDIYGISEAALHGDTALLVPPGDVDSLREALRLLVASAELRRRMGAKGRTRFDAMFTLDRHIDRIETIYSEVLAGDRAQ